MKSKVRTGEKWQSPFGKNWQPEHRDLAQQEQREKAGTRTPRHCTPVIRAFPLLAHPPRSRVTNSNTSSGQTGDKRGTESKDEKNAHTFFVSP